MVSKVITRLEDDVDGSEASQTVMFGLDGTAYEIDLSDKNAGALRDALADWVSHARKVGGRRSTKAGKPFSEVDTKAVRAWAAANGIEVSERGRISADVLDKYRASGH
jgi:hypothetical protein